MNHRTGHDLKATNSLLPIFPVTHLCTEFNTKPCKNKHLGTVILSLLTVFLVTVSLQRLTYITTQTFSRIIDSGLHTFLQ